MKQIKLSSRLLFLPVIFIAIGLSMLVVQPAQAVVVLSNLTAGDGISTTIKNTSRRAAGFSIPTEHDFTLNSVTLRLANPGTSARNVIVEIRADLNSNPGAIIESLNTIILNADTEASNFTTTPSTPVTLSAGRTYWIVVYATNNSQWIASDQGQLPSGLFTFTGYRSSSDGGTTWSNSRTSQSKLYIDASAPGFPTNTVTPTFTPSNTPTPTITPTPSSTRRPSRTPKPSRTPRTTHTQTPTETASKTETATATPTKTATLTTEESTAELTGTAEATVEATETAEVTATAEVSSTCQLTTIAAVRMRQTPSLTSQVVGGVPDHTTMPRLEYVTGWYRVTYEGASGWINASLVTTDGNCS